MLKALVQLFAEKFLVSKRETVQGWTNLKNSAAVEIPIPANATTVSYVAPSNGLIQVGIRYGASDGYSCQLFVEKNPVAPNIYFVGLVGWSDHCIRVAKGDNIKIMCSKYDSRSRYYFIPFN